MDIWFSLGLRGNIEVRVAKKGTGDGVEWMGFRRSEFVRGADATTGESGVVANEILIWKQRLPTYWIDHRPFFPKHINFPRPTGDGLSDAEYG